MSKGNLGAFISTFLFIGSVHAQDPALVPVGSVDIEAVAALSNDIDEQLNKLIQNPALLGNANAVASTKIYKDAVDTKVYNYRIGEQGQPITIDELKELRGILLRKSDAFKILRQNGFQIESPFGEVQISEDGLRGRITDSLNLEAPATAEAAR